jgi:uncharacterized protein (DUF488 family)
VATLYTIGHSTRTLEDFLAVLKAHHIETLVDVRAFPMSRRLPHFNREALQTALQRQGIEYIWMKELGGRRKRQLPPEESPNVALRNESFRNYADYMLSPEFHAAAAEVEALAAKSRTSIMCAEMLFFRCHRMLVSDYFALRGHDVLHIQNESAPAPHRLTKEARCDSGQVIYRGDRLL